MILYRARTIASRPARHTEYQGNDAAVRVAGRWFTSDLQQAIAHRSTLDGASEIVAIEVPCEIVDGFRVATTPTTACGIDAAAHSVAPETDYVVQMFRVMGAEVIAADMSGRIRDYIDVNAPRTATMHTLAARKPVQDADLALAA